MPAFAPHCLYCPDKRLLVRKGYYNVYEGGHEPLYALVRLAVPLAHGERKPHAEAFLTPVQVYVCMSCSFLALFSEDVENEWKWTGQATANRLDEELRQGN